MHPLVSKERLRSRLFVCWNRAPRIAATAALLVAFLSGALSRPAHGDDSAGVDATQLAQQVTIYRDAFGVPHIDGPTDESVIFGFAYAQAEDFFWQIEDSYILGLGRYAEVLGPKGLNSDLLNRAFEVVPSSKADYAKLEPEARAMCAAFVAGLNFYLETHPETKPRLITRFEPWQMLAFSRQMQLELTFRYTRLTNNYMPRMAPMIAAATGSNGWAIAPQRTESGHAMLLANPHQPWYGFGQLYEGHLRSGEGWNFTGATFFGSPMPTIGHNEHAGWTFTTNEPDVADLWRETFDDPANPLNYRYGDGYRQAVEWQEPIRVKYAATTAEKTYTFRKTHHGPIVSKEDDVHQLSAMVAKLYDSLLLRQTLMLARTKNVEDFQAAMGSMNFPIMNAIYADRRGDIYYLYNGAIPRRDPSFDWSKPVDGADPRTEWQGYHTIDELPQTLNPSSGFIQNCNSTPYTTTDDGNPNAALHPPYMVEDRDDDKRRAKMSRQLLREMYDVSFEDLQQAAFDTTLYWAQTELPQYKRAWEQLKDSDPDLASRVGPYIEHLLNWDYRVTLESTQAPLCVAWYEELYGNNYPGEKLKAQYADKPAAQFKALIQAAARLQSLHGSWKVPFGDIYRIQRHANVAELIDIPFTDDLPSLPCAGSHGPMGIVFTQYYTPSINIPFVRKANKHYGVVGVTYLAAYEFGDKIRGASLTQFGSSGLANSPHFFDQATLVSERRLKPELFYWDDVLAGAKLVYHPGEPPKAPRIAASAVGN